MSRQRTLKLSLLCAAVAVPMAMAVAQADTLEGALADAYRNNPALNAQRANVRSIDESVPQALAGYRPRIAATAQGGQQSISTTTKTTSSGISTPFGQFGAGTSYLTQSGYNTPFSTGLTITQTL